MIRVTCTQNKEGKKRFRSCFGNLNSSVTYSIKNDGCDDMLLFEFCDTKKKKKNQF